MLILNLAVANLLFILICVSAIHINIIIIMDITGGRPPVHPHLRPLHSQRLRPHVLALRPLLVSCCFRPYVFISYHPIMIPFINTLIGPLGHHHPYHYRHHHHHGYDRCRSVQYIIYVTAYVSIYTLVLMAGDRFLAVVCPVSSITIRFIFTPSTFSSFLSLFLSL